MTQNTDRFKTRVWDKMRNTFLPENSYYIRQDGCISFYQSFTKQKGNYDYAGEFDKDRYIKQQCTGQKDKNGKLIYEGDIIYDKIRYGRYFRDYDITAYVIFDLISFRMRLLTKLKNFPNTKFLDLIMHSIPNELEILGNIYENPELIKIPLDF